MNEDCGSDGQRLEKKTTDLNGEVGDDEGEEEEMDERESFHRLYDIETQIGHDDEPLKQSWFDDNDFVEV